MSCETEDEANDFCKYLDSVGKKWFDGKSYLEFNRYELYKDEICYCFNKDECDQRICAIKSGFKILKFKDFTFEIKEKEDKSFPQIGDTYTNSKLDIYYQHLNIFWQTFKECERYNEIKQKEMELSHKFTKEEWKNKNITKYGIVCKHDETRLSISYRQQWQRASVIFKTKEDVQLFIDFCGYEDYCKYVLGVK